MEELIDYDFPFSISLIGVDDFNDKFCKQKLLILKSKNFINIKKISDTPINTKWL